MEMFITAHSWLTESLITHNYILIEGWYTTTKLPMTCHKLYTDQPGLLTTDFNANSELLSGISSILLCKFQKFQTSHTHCIHTLQHKKSKFSESLHITHLNSNYRRSMSWILFSAFVIYFLPVTATDISESSF